MEGNGKEPGPQRTSDDSHGDNGERYKGIKSFLRVVIFIALVLLVFGSIFILPEVMEPYGITVTSGGFDIFTVLMLGVLVGFIELISRYNDAPFQAAVSYPGLFYMLINGLVAVAALLMIRLFGWNFLPGNSNASLEVERWTQVLVAGLGAMSIFRSSLLVIGKGDQEVSVGPSAVLEILLNTIDKEVDRDQGQKRAKLVKHLMNDITYKDALYELPPLCKTLMQNLSPKDDDKITKLPGQVDKPTVSELVKKYQLGLELLEVVGEDVLRQAILVMKKDLKKVDEVKSDISTVKDSQEVLQEFLNQKSGGQ